MGHNLAPSLVLLPLLLFLLVKSSVEALCVSGPRHRGEALLAELARGEEVDGTVLRAQAPQASLPWLHSLLSGLPRQLASAFPVDLIGEHEGQRGVEDTLDAWLVPSHQLADLAASGLAADVGWMVKLDRGLAWWDFVPQHRDGLALYGGSVFAVPLGSSPLLQFTRQDVLAAAQEQVPRTWQQLASFAHRYSAIRRDIDPQYALCLPPGTDCTQLHLLHAVWASVAQTQGRHQGLCFDPWSGAPRVDTAALHYTLALLANLSAHSVGDSGEACGMGIASAGFSSGLCVITLATSAQVQSLHTYGQQAGPTAHLAYQEQGQKQAAPGLGTATGLGAPELGVIVTEIPGSEVVWDEKVDQLVACDSQYCPLGEAYPAASADVVHDQPSGPSAIAGAGTAVREQLMNRSPQLAAVSLVGVISARAQPPAQLKAYLLFAHLAGAGSDAACHLLNGSALAPIRASCLAASAADDSVASALLTGLAGNNGSETNPGGSPNDGSTLPPPSPALVALIRDAIRLGAADAVHGNAWWPGGVPRWQVLREELRGLLGSAIACAVTGNTGSNNATKQSPDASNGDDWLSQWPCSQRLQQALQKAQARVAATYTPQDILPAYRTFIGLSTRIARLDSGQGTTDASADATCCTPAGSSTGGGSGGQDHLAEKIGIPLCAALLLVVIVLLLLNRRRRLTLLGRMVSRLMPHRTRWGAPAPGPSPDTCLVVTDIQDSTMLWEALPASVMDESVGLHHACLRRLLLRYDGYESATEGDSFILAFSRPTDALAFALDAQSSLIETEWPAQLLEERICAPVWTPLPPGFPFSGRLTPPHHHRKRLSQLWHSADQESDGSAPPSCVLDSMARAASGGGDGGGGGATEGSPVSAIPEGLDDTLGCNTLMGTQSSAQVNISDRDDATGGNGDDSERRSFFSGRLTAPANARLKTPICTALPRPPSGQRISGGGRFSMDLSAARRWASVERPPATTEGYLLTCRDRSVLPSREDVPQLEAAAGAADGEEPWSHLAASLAARTPTRQPPLTLGQWMQQEVAGGAVSASVRHQGGAMPTAHAPGRSRTEVGAVATTPRGARARGVSASGIVDRMGASAAPHVSCVFRGLRVRIGVSSGPATEAEVLENSASQRTVYCGPASVLAKQVADAAHGGMVTVSGAVMERLAAAGSRDATASARLPPHWVVRAGRYSWEPYGCDMDLCLAWPHAITQRIALLPPPRCGPQAVVPSVYEAPLWEAAIATLHLPDVKELMSWDDAATRSGLAVFCDVVYREAKAHGAYLASVPDPYGSWGGATAGGGDDSPALAVVAAFSGALAAARWALSVQEALAQAEWAPGLLQHEACQEAVLPLVDAAGEQHRPRRHQRQRGASLLLRSSLLLMQSFISPKTPPANPNPAMQHQQLFFGQQLLPPISSRIREMPRLRFGAPSEDQADRDPAVEALGSGGDECWGGADNVQLASGDSSGGDDETIQSISHLIVIGPGLREERDPDVASTRSEQRPWSTEAPSASLLDAPCTSPRGDAAPVCRSPLSDGEGRAAAPALGPLPEDAARFPPASYYVEGLPAKLPSRLALRGSQHRLSLLGRASRGSVATSPARIAPTSGDVLDSSGSQNSPSGGGGRRVLSRGSAAAELQPPAQPAPSSSAPPYQHHYRQHSTATRPIAARPSDVTDPTARPAGDASGAATYCDDDPAAADLACSPYPAPLTTLDLPAAAVTADTGRDGPHTWRGGRFTDRSSCRPRLSAPLHASVLGSSVSSRGLRAASSGSLPSPLSIAAAALRLQLPFARSLKPPPSPPLGALPYHPHGTAAAASAAEWAAGSSGAEAASPATGGGNQTGDAGVQTSVRTCLFPAGGLGAARTSATGMARGPALGGFRRAIDEGGDWSNVRDSTASATRCTGWGQQPEDGSGEDGGEMWCVRVRGLRVQVGIDMGCVNWSAPQAAAALCYTGSVVRKGRKLALCARPGQVLLSQQACDALVAAQLAQVPWRRTAAGCGPDGSSRCALGNGGAHAAMISSDFSAVRPSEADATALPQVNGDRSLEAIAGGGVSNGRRLSEDGRAPDPAAGTEGEGAPQLPALLRPIALAPLQCRKARSSGGVVFVCKFADSWQSAVASMYRTPPEPPAAPSTLFRTLTTNPLASTPHKARKWHFNTPSGEPAASEPLPRLFSPTACTAHPVSYDFASAVAGARARRNAFGAHVATGATAGAGASPSRDGGCGASGGLGSSVTLGAGLGGMWLLTSSQNIPSHASVAAAQGAARGHHRHHVLPESAADCTRSAPLRAAYLSNTIYATRGGADAAGGSSGALGVEVLSPPGCLAQAAPCLQLPRRERGDACRVRLGDSSRGGSNTAAALLGGTDGDGDGDGDDNPDDDGDDDGDAEAHTPERPASSPRLAASPVTMGPAADRGSCGGRSLQASPPPRRYRCAPLDVEYGAAAAAAVQRPPQAAGRVAADFATGRSGAAPGEWAAKGGAGTAGGAAGAGAASATQRESSPTWIGGLDPGGGDSLILVTGLEREWEEDEEGGAGASARAVEAEAREAVAWGGVVAVDLHGRDS